MRGITEVINNLKTQGLISHQSISYKCGICRDTGWVLSATNTYKQCNCVRKERSERLWEQYGIKPSRVKKINDYLPYDDVTAKAKEKSVEYIRSFNELKECENNWFALFGQPGSGKSHIVIAMGAALLKNNVSVVYMPYTEVMKEIKGNATNQEAYLRLVNRYMKAEVLVIDDLFKDKVKNGNIVADLTDVDIKHVYPILNYRYYNSLPTIISSECIPDILMELDEAQGGRILQRCVTKIVFKGHGYDYRVREFIV